MIQKVSPGLFPGHFHYTYYLSILLKILNDLQCKAIKTSGMKYYQRLYDKLISQYVIMAS
jgi:hypothetical protein